MNNMQIENTKAEVLREPLSLNRFCKVVINTIIGWHVKGVPIADVRCERTKVSMQEGWGGLSIHKFPPYRFFKILNEGHEKLAREGYENFYYDRFIGRKLHAVSKAEGGMHNGSLYRSVEKIHHAEGHRLMSDCGNANEFLIRKAIGKEVSRRFELLESIRLHGYFCEWDHVRCRRKASHYELIDGHHRVAALCACDHSSISIICSNSITLRIASRIARRLTI